MADVYDVAVIGLGAMGSATLYNLARRGRRVIGFDRFVPGHDRGSSHGESRIIRLSYFEDPSYVPLLHEAYEAWRGFETEDGDAAGSLLTITGILEAGHPGSIVVGNSLKASRLHGLAHEELDAAAIRRRFPAFDVPPDWRGLFQPDGGLLRPEAAVRRYVAAAEIRGATVREETTVTSIEARPNAVSVRTATETIEVGAVVIAAGAWVTDLVPELAPHLTVTRQVLGWFTPRRPELFALGRFPVFILQSEDDHIYGFPDFAGSGVKTASHERGRTLRHASELAPDGDADDEAAITRMISRYLPDLDTPATKLVPCMYTRTDDAHFIIDRAPSDPRIVVASPCSGHGFKFASLFGRVLADMADGLEPKQNLDLFRLSRRVV